MDAAGQLGGEDFVDPALAGNAALPGEGGRYHLDAEMGLAAFAVAGMALVFFRIINDLKTLRRKCLGPLVLHRLCYGHCRLILRYSVLPAPEGVTRPAHCQRPPLSASYPNARHPTHRRRPPPT